MLGMIYDFDLHWEKYWCEIHRLMQHIGQSLNVFIIYLILCHNCNHARKTASFNNVLHLIHFDGKWNSFHGFLIHTAEVWVKLKIDRCYQHRSLSVSTILLWKWNISIENIFISPCLNLDVVCERENTNNNDHQYLLFK